MSNETRNRIVVFIQVFIQIFYGNIFQNNNFLFEVKLKKLNLLHKTRIPHTYWTILMDRIE